MNLEGKRILVTGVASFIGSTLADALLKRNPKSLAGIDDLSAGREANIEDIIRSGKLHFVKGDCREQGLFRSLLKQQKPDIVFHLAADHGGRGYVDLHNAECANNIFLSGMILHECVKAGVEKVTFASSGCCTAETRVETEYGSEQMGDVFSSLSLNENRETLITEKGWGQLDEMWSLGEKDCITITTESGYSLTGGREHRIKVLARTGQIEWRKLQDIQDTDRVILIGDTARGLNQLPHFQNKDTRHKQGGTRIPITTPSIMTPQLAEIIGYFVGDGCIIPQNGHIVFAENQRDVLVHINRSIYKIFGVRGNIKRRKGRSGNISYTLVICSRNLMEFFELICGHQRSLECSVPQSIWLSDKKCRAAFLRGIFEADGGMNRASNTITFTSNSKQLAHDVHQLLLSVGVFTRLRSRIRNSGYSNGNATYEIRVCYMENNRMYAGLIGFISADKQNLLTQISRAWSCESLGIPHIAKDIRKFRPWQKRKGEGHASPRQESYARWFSRNRAKTIPRKRMREYLDANLVEQAEREKWIWLLKHSVSIDKIKSIDKKRLPVYDFTVSPSHSYISNGFISHNCVYQNNLQTDVLEELYLTEDIVGPPYLHPQDADNMYGWSKLMTEMTMYYYVKGGKLPSAAACRYFTVYGPRGKVDHAIIAMIGRAFIRQNPFKIWGTRHNSALRNWTHVDDIVSGTIAAAEYDGDYIAVNLGTMEKTSVSEAAELAVQVANELRPDEYYDPKFEYLTSMPVGPLNRIADNSFAKEKLGWAPRIMLKDGIRTTAKWFFETQDIEVIKKHFADESNLTKR